MRLFSLVLTASVIALSAGTAFADDIQMLPPVTEASRSTATLVPCPANADGSPSLLAWDGTHAIDCTSGITATGGNVAATGEVQVGNSGAQCTSVNAGAIRFDQTTSGLEYCNGTQWTTLGGPKYQFMDFITSGTLCGGIPGQASAAINTTTGARYCENVVAGCNGWSTGSGSCFQTLP